MAGARAAAGSPQRHLIASALRHMPLCLSLWEARPRQARTRTRGASARATDRRLSLACASLHHSKHKHHATTHPSKARQSSITTNSRRHMDGDHSWIRMARVLHSKSPGGGDDAMPVPRVHRRCIPLNHQMRACPSSPVTGHRRHGNNILTSGKSLPRVSDRNRLIVCRCAGVVDNKQIERAFVSRHRQSKQQHAPHDFPAVQCSQQGLRFGACGRVY